MLIIMMVMIDQDFYLILCTSEHCQEGCLNLSSFHLLNHENLRSLHTSEKGLLLNWYCIMSSQKPQPILITYERKYLISLELRHPEPLLIAYKR